MDDAHIFLAREQMADEWRRTTNFFNPGRNPTMSFR